VIYSTIKKKVLHIDTVERGEKRSQKPWKVHDRLKFGFSLAVVVDLRWFLSISFRHFLLLIFVPLKASKLFGLLICRLWAYPMKVSVSETRQTSKQNRQEPLSYRGTWVWRYQRGNQNPYIAEEQTTQWPKEKVQKDKQRSAKHIYKTKDRVTRTPLIW
jgi:hypothetical protein